jgi:hypothetical protein
MEPTETAHLNENYLPIAGNDVAPDRLDCPLNHPSSRSFGAPGAKQRERKKNDHTAESLSSVVSLVCLVGSNPCFFRKTALICAIYG